MAGVRMTNMLRRGDPNGTRASGNLEKGACFILDAIKDATPDLCLGLGSINLVPVNHLQRVLEATARAR